MFQHDLAMLYNSELYKLNTEIYVQCTKSDAWVKQKLEEMTTSFDINTLLHIYQFNQSYRDESKQLLMEWIERMNAE
jgi:hypothetical protein